MTQSRADIEQLLAQIEEQERTLWFASFGPDDAWKLGRTIRRLGREREQPIAIHVRLGEQLMFHAALPGSSADNDDWIARKIRTTGRFGTSSLAVRLRSELAGGFGWLDPAVYALAGGCVPIRIAGAIVGTATVSGLPDTEDHALVVEAITSLLG